MNSKKTFYYGYDGQRILMISKVDGVETSRKYYCGEYEYTINSNPTTIKEVSFISTPTGLAAANVKVGSTATFYYILTDQLGSITQLINEQNVTITGGRFTYDAWGRLRDVTQTSDVYDIHSIKTAFSILDHAIINMNGRIYDPITAQFMQADNFIQTPEDYIGYNRYAYCRYNPFKFVDPSGEMLMYHFGDNAVESAWFIDENMSGTSQNALQSEEDIYNEEVAWLRKARGIGSPGGSGDEAPKNGVGRRGSDILSIPLDPNKIKIGQTIIGKDGKQYMKGENGLFYAVEGGNSNDGGNTTSTETNFILTGVTWGWGTAMSVLRLIPEEAFSKVMLKSSTLFSIGAAVYDSYLIGSEYNGDNIASTILGIGANAGLCYASNFCPPIGIPLSFGYWLGDYFCKENCMGASLVQMGCFYQFWEVPTPWYKK